MTQKGPFLCSVHAGPRQTVTRVRHPLRGIGFAVCDNGPSFFETDEGKRIDMNICAGGAEMGPPARSWMLLFDPDHGRVEADRIGKSGPSHQRKLFPLIGPGWLVWGTDCLMRFEPDDGKTFGFEWGKVCVGTADYAQRHEKASRSRKKVYPEMTEEEKHWVTFYARTGEVYSFRDEKDATP